jgi:putative flippase GtrA
MTLLSPDRGIVGQGVRFALAGGLVTLLYTLTTIVLADVVGLPFQIALLIGYCVGLATHFTLQRVFVWVHHEEFALPLHEQAGRYVIMAGVQYGLTVASTAILPAATGIPVEWIYIGTVICLVSVNFFVFRGAIFHPKASDLTCAATGTDTEQPSPS